MISILLNADRTCRSLENSVSQSFKDLVGMGLKSEAVKTVLRAEVRGLLRQLKEFAERQLAGLGN